MAIRLRFRTLLRLRPFSPAAISVLVVGAGLFKDPAAPPSEGDKVEAKLKAVTEKLSWRRRGLALSRQWRGLRFSRPFRTVPFSPEEMMRPPAPPLPEARGRTLRSCSPAFRGQRHSDDDFFRLWA
jgi:hypothetical protein